jgi:hypothetical protein
MTSLYRRRSGLGLLTNYAGYLAYFILTAPLGVVLAVENVSKYRNNLNFEEISCIPLRIVKMWEHY